MARELGMKQVPVVRLDVKDVDRRLLRQVLNKLKGQHVPELDQDEFLRIIEAGGEEDLRQFLLASSSIFALTPGVLRSRSIVFSLTWSSSAILVIVHPSQQGYALTHFDYVLRRNDDENDISRDGLSLI